MVVAVSCWRERAGTQCFSMQRRLEQMVCHSAATLTHRSKAQTFAATRGTHQTFQLPYTFRYLETQYFASPGRGYLEHN